MPGRLLPDCDEIPSAAWDARATLAPAGGAREQQIDPEPAIADAQPTLTTHECEVTAELDQERLEIVDQRVLQVGLGVLVVEAEELEHERVLDFLLGRHRVSCARGLTLGQHRALVS